MSGDAAAVMPTTIIGIPVKHEAKSNFGFKPAIKKYMYRQPVLVATSI